MLADGMLVKRQRQALDVEEDDREGPVYDHQGGVPPEDLPGGPGVPGVGHRALLLPRPAAQQGPQPHPGLSAKAVVWWLASKDWQSS